MLTKDRALTRSRPRVARLPGRFGLFRAPYLPRVCQTLATCGAPPGSTRAGEQWNAAWSWPRCPGTRYNDYAISPVRFHWETVGTCHEGTETARRYLRTTRGADVHGLSFVRQRRTDPRGETMPYVFLGEVFYAIYRGNRPMQMEWDLAHPMPASFFQATKIAAG